MYSLLLVAACCGISIAMAIENTNSNNDVNPKLLQQEIRHEQQRELEDADGTIELDMSEPESRDQYLEWMRQIVQKNHYKHMNEDQQPLGVSKNSALLPELLANLAVRAHLQAEDMSSPSQHFTKLNKRNNGIWIWMPSQGYVSVPQQEDSINGDVSNPGKIMRYGRK